MIRRVLTVLLLAALVTACAGAMDYFTESPRPSQLIFLVLTGVFAGAAIQYQYPVDDF